MTAPIPAPDADAAIPLSALYELLDGDPYITLRRALTLADWALRHGAFTARPMLVMRPEYPSGVTREVQAMIDRIAPRPILREPEGEMTCDDAPVGYRARTITTPERPSSRTAATHQRSGPHAAPAPSSPGRKAEMHPEDESGTRDAPPSPAADVPAAPAEGGAGIQVAAIPLTGEQLLADATEDPDEQERRGAVAAHVAMLQQTSIFGPADDEYLVRATLDGVAPSIISDQLDCGTADIRARWNQLQVPGITTVNGKRDVDGCRLLLEMLVRRADIESRPPGSVR